ncbi:HPP family protein (plasmid) [Pseudoalteromonas xiamenensis]|uniref:HPP family protein n=1 Tax=Pseudoalteromonas xiamenensis TaxID=882626 RepID=UPI0027E3E696|nr:HPP family protein [Pseudoalteromonas xiamenensis]WMN62050.1 HPP family protein [Pseudoalteromonas xiamenensis]
MKNVMLSLFAGFGAFVAIALLSIFDASFQDVVLLMAPFGATTVLVFGVPQSPLAQPKNVILGHLITAFIGVFFVQFFAVTPVSMALATGLAVSAMLITKTTHPPAGANPLLIMLSGQSWMFLLTPVLTGAIAIVLIGRLMANIQRRWAD